MHKCVNNTIGNVYHLEQWVDNFFPYSQKQLRFDQPVSIVFQSDEENASRMLGKTAYYDPESMQVVLYTDNRHPKDVMRSLSHELVHHAQNCRGDFKPGSGMETGYAQSDPHLRAMEREAYTKGNLIFRDFEDLIKTGKINIEIDFSDSGEPKMSLKEWKNDEINTKLMKKWGFLKESKEVTTEDTEELDERMPGVPDSARSWKANSQLQPRAGHEPLDLAAKRAGSKSVKDGQIDMKILNKEIALAIKDENTYARPSPTSRGDQGYWQAGMRTAALQNLAKRFGAEEDGSKETPQRARGPWPPAKTLEEQAGHDGPCGPGCGCEGMEESMPYRDDERDDSSKDQAWNDWKNEHADDDHIKEIEHHLRALQDDRDYERDGAEDELEEGAGAWGKRARMKALTDKDYEGIGSEESEDQTGNQYSIGDATKTRGDLEAPTATAALNRMRRRRPVSTKALRRENTKISVKEAKQITRRIIERIKKESK